MTDDKLVRAKLTPGEVADIITRATGVEVSAKTHWFRVTMEATRELPPTH